MRWRLPGCPCSSESSVSAWSPTFGSNAAISRLIDCSKRLVLCEGEVCTDTEEASEACSAFLQQVDRCASALRVKPASRAYRATFTVHYRAAVPDGGRHYRVEVLAASLAQHGAIWVNGAKFEFSAEVLHCGGALKQQIASLYTYLSELATGAPDSPSSSSTAKSPQSARRAELSAKLAAFDTVWTSFEEAYIGQLMEIEKSARGLLVEAIYHEQLLRFAEEDCEDLGHMSDECIKQQGEFFTCLSRLNSVANVNRKGREDLSAEVFEAAAKAAKRGEDAPCSPNAVIVTEVARSYKAMRDYLRRVEPFLDQVAPRLSENVGLAARLAQLEEGWELGFTYLLHETMRNAMNSLVLELKAAQRIDPQLTSLCETCDVEWLLVLPKLVWICFLEYPERHMEVLRSLLPHRFPEGSSGCGDIRCCDPAIQALRVRFQRIYSLLGRKNTSRGGHAKDMLVRWIAFGTEGLGIPAADLEQGGELYEVVEFVKDLDAWSMELQRHCPQDWNQCSSLLVRCLTGCQRPQTQGDFVV